VRRAGGVRHQLTSHSSSNLLHELLGQATYNTVQHTECYGNETS